jgi:hypothetical protein
VARPFGSLTIASKTFDGLYDQPQNIYTFVTMQGGVTAQNTAALEKTLDPYPNAKVADRDQFVDDQISGLNTIPNVLYVLLALSIIVSLFGIVNTLVLSVFERTRESECSGERNDRRKSAHDPARERHTVDRRGDRNRARIVVGRCSPRASTSWLRRALHVADHLRRRCDRGRGARGDPARTPGVEAERARSAAIE